PTGWVLERDAQATLCSTDSRVRAPAAWTGLSKPRGLCLSEALKLRAVARAVLSVQSSAGRRRYALL
ncbi:MAG: hypothetical protein N2554_00845, partial [Fimbriimonadales bacterium]|nr:hypothetical protein [Fimbriimonadales bacterium]